MIAGFTLHSLKYCLNYSKFIFESARLQELRKSQLLSSIKAAHWAGPEILDFWNCSIRFWMKSNFAVVITKNRVQATYTTKKWRGKACSLLITAGRAGVKRRQLWQLQIGRSSHSLAVAVVPASLFVAVSKGSPAFHGSGTLGNAVVQWLVFWLRQETGLENCTIRSCFAFFLSYHS